MKRLVTLLTVFFLLACVPAWVSSGDGLKESEKKLEDVKQKLSREKTRIKRFKKKETTILGDIQRVNRNLVKKRAQLKKVEASLGRVKADIRDTEARIKPLERERKALLGRFNKRLKAMYKMRNGSALNVIFSAGLEDTATLARRSRYLTLLMDSDSDLIGKVDENITRLRDERLRLDVLKAELESSKRDAIAKRREAESIKRKKLALLRDVKNKKERSIRISEELNTAAEELSDLLERLRAGKGGFGAGGFASMKGRLIRPVKGRVVSRYGKVRHPKFKTVTFNNGIMIDSPAGVSVKSVYDGKVIFTGWLKGYGQLMILDNGGGYYTLYAHLDNILKERGDVVKKGDEIAIVGDTGPQATPGLYFEIRERGVPKDPLKWLASR